ncbi:MAG: type II toxin-antitoxin system Phd/YefM family antitoxin [Myxococcota bacterium]
MIRLNVHEAKTNLSRYLDEVEAGEVVVLCRRNVPIAEIRRIAPQRAQPRPFGLAKERFGAFEVPATFDEPLPDWMIEAFSGRTS